jgi:NTP pyrophosphatase (non-canonical NTP hydrolase)
MRELQKLIDNRIPEIGGYWPVDEICLRLAEECGELCQARRKGTPDQIAHEIGDVIFTAVCLANVLHVDLDTVMRERIQFAKFKQSKDMA